MTRLDQCTASHKLLKALIKLIDVLRGTKQKRHRDGYEDRATILRKVSSAADFIWSDSPLEILGSVTSITFDDAASLHTKDHSLTTEEVKALCDDLRVGEGDLGKYDTPATDTSDSSSDDSKDEDSDTKAEILACAKKMLRKKQREQILDDAYNKYMFDDEGLPIWFLEEERRHRQPIKPVTKEDIAAMPEKFKEINVRPAKKVADAKAQKKRATTRKLEKVRKKANSISDQADISDRSKRKLIEELYEKATPKRPKKEFVVVKKGVRVKAGKGKVLVDRRMKKDARIRGMGKPDKGSSKKGKKVKAQKGRDSARSSGKKGNKGKMGMHD
ncbi:hypothetical protein SLEP1_g31148 [Rubroshorea leprosula]|uniref:Ribosomal RNA methyltransferase SPB1-like C-terminal domain-containing protein n=1 Tax=Rubroshorea leprosula TaxID=152421 RepID=A0AAV5K8M5_9ROSI|nr:hypothetical protein SLEP1_g31148 [Rubroshorea leprosula]